MSVPDDDLIRRLEAGANPIGGAHSPMPWKAAASTVGDGEHFIEDVRSEAVALFKRKEDRDLVLYFTNVHAGIIAAIRSMANGFEFAALSAASEPALRSYCTQQAELARVYADLFASMGRMAQQQQGGADDGGVGP